MNTDNGYLQRLAYEVQVALNCNEEDAAKIVTAVLGLGKDPIKFVHSLPDLVGEERPTIDELLAELEAIREKNGAIRYTACFPAGYRNREARRKAKRKGGRC